MKFENHTIKTLGEDVFYRHYVLYIYFKIKIIRQKFKILSDRKKKHKPGEW